MEEMTFYLSGPMTGLPEYNYPHFNAVAKQLRSQGMKILSPAEVDGGEQVTNGEAEKKPYSYWLKSAMRMMCEADAIIMLEGWTQSKGARAELDFALDCGLPAYRLELGTTYHNGYESGRQSVLVLVDLDAGIEDPSA